MKKSIIFCFLLCAIAVSNSSAYISKTIYDKVFFKVVNDWKFGSAELFGLGMNYYVNFLGGIGSNGYHTIEKN